MIRGATCVSSVSALQKPPGSSIPLTIKSKMLTVAPVASMPRSLPPSPVSPLATRPTGDAVLCWDHAKRVCLRVFAPSLLSLPGLANKDTGCPVNMSHAIFVYLNFTCNQTPCALSGTPEISPDSAPSGCHMACALISSRCLLSSAEALPFYPISSRSPICLLSFRALSTP